MSETAGLPRRLGLRPETSTTGPHRQLTQRATPELWARLVLRSVSIEGVCEGRSSVSLPDSRALLLLGMPSRHDERSLAVSGPIEPVHLRSVADTSVHLCLPAARAREACEALRGEPHPYADYETQLMLYGPRDAAELELIYGLIVESIAFARTLD